jgi:hypothetical protein
MRIDTCPHRRLARSGQPIFSKKSRNRRSGLVQDGREAAGTNTPFMMISLRAEMSSPRIPGAILARRAGLQYELIHRRKSGGPAGVP